MSRLLLNTNHLANFGGSEMVTLELAEEFLIRGWEVDVYTNYAALPFIDEFTELSRQETFNLYEADAPRNLKEYDLLWVQHSVAPTAIIQQLSDSGLKIPLVWHHMSSLPSIESPVLADVELAAASVISCISEETADVLSSYGITRERISILPNPVPRAFSETPLMTSSGATLDRVLLVSNHPPSELAAATELLEQRGVEVRSIGAERPARVTPESFTGVDAVITIGKSVQYALCLGIPVYNYDHFGGAGWLTDSNFEAERAFNFSGRPHKRTLPALELVDELISGYEAARAFAHDEAPRNRSLFSLPAHIDRILDRSAAQQPSAPLTAGHALRWQAYARMQQESTRALQGAWNEVVSLTADLHRAQEHVSSLEDEVKKYARENEALLYSGSFRLGNALLKPVRKLLHR